jgi:hypothetical protein
VGDRRGSGLGSGPGSGLGSGPGSGLGSRPGSRPGSGPGNGLGIVARVAMALALLCLVVACDKAEAGSPEAVADAFCDAYFREADQAKAKQFTAFGATRMLDQEIEDVKGVRESGYDARDAQLDVAIRRGERTNRGERVRFDYVLRYEDRAGEVLKHADVELARVHEEWKVVRVGLSKQDSPPPLGDP